MAARGSETQVVGLRQFTEPRRRGNDQAKRFFTAPAASVTRPPNGKSYRAGTVIVTVAIVGLAASAMARPD